MLYNPRLTKPFYHHHHSAAVVRRPFRRLQWRLTGKTHSSGCRCRPPFLISPENTAADVVSLTRQHRRRTPLLRGFFSFLGCSEMLLEPPSPSWSQSHTHECVCGVCRCRLCRLPSFFPQFSFAFWYGYVVGAVEKKRIQKTDPHDPRDQRKRYNGAKKERKLIRCIISIH